ncbi:MAG TPA: flagellar basal body-associated FliL family protein, partial [Sulfuricurvum sp.]|nr:flagellar basal body-associated FliL family protein [Sulfuricurvum sp.]
MANKEHEEHVPADEEKKKSGNMLLIIIIVVLALILVIGGVIAMMMMGNHDAEGESTSSTQKEASAHGEEKPADEHAASAEGDGHGTPSTEVGIMYPLDLFTVNLLSESGRRYLKVEMNLELEGEELAMELDTKKPVLRDVIIRLLSS